MRAAFLILWLAVSVAALAKVSFEIGRYFGEQDERHMPHIWGYECQRADADGNVVTCTKREPTCLSTDPNGCP